MNGEVWVNLAADFGAPWKCFVLDLRSPLGQKFVAQLKAHGDDRAKWLPVVARDIVVEARTHLDEDTGLVVIGIREQGFGRIGIEAIHHSFEPMKQGSFPKLERLELCPVCHNPLSLTESWARAVPSGYEEVCSKECADVLGQRQGREFL